MHQRPGLLRLMLSALAAPALPLSAQTTRPTAPPPSRPNVLLIVSDDLTTALGCYGNPVVKTPNIDRLAARSIRFQHAYCQFPVCNPSRASMLSGLTPEACGVLSNKENYQPGPHDPPFLPMHFRNNGYTTIQIGKIFHGHEGDDTEHTGLGTDSPESWCEVIDKPFVPLDHKDHARLAKNSRGVGEFRDSRPLKGETDENIYDAIAAREAATLLRQRGRGDQPLFVAVGFRKPHLPWRVPQNYYDLYSLDQMNLPEVPAWHLKTLLPIAENNSAKANPREEEDPRVSLRGYYATVSFVDHQLGQILDALDQTHQWDNTILVFVGDNGFHLGEHGMWGKRVLFEESCIVPLIIAAPGKAPGVSPRPVEMLDIYPTLADLCGLPTPQGLMGASLRPLIDNPHAPWSRVAYTITKKDEVIGRSIRTEQYRYTEWNNGKAGIELYDHQADPHEFRNLASDPAHAQTLAMMKSLLAAREHPIRDLAHRDALERIFGSHKRFAALTGCIAATLAGGFFAFSLWSYRRKMAHHP